MHHSGFLCAAVVALVAVAFVVIALAFPGFIRPAVIANFV